MARSLGAQPGRVLVVGCEPETLEDETGRIELSAAVESAVPVAIETVRLLIEDFNQRPETMAVGVEGHG
jgi:Ni,Fe-hydrogenase maturation factor